LLGSALFDSQEFQVLDVKDALGVELCVANFQPTIIIHAAALKHLAVLENQPREAYLTNVIGTHNVLKAAVQFNTRKFLNISTDKAANPISILGKSKYIGELLTAKYGDLSEKNFMSVRFGNVFNSRGSVIETFARQLEFNLPVTLTDINVSRYFMKIEEAASLCLSALFLNNSAIYMLDMGEPIKLIEIIEKMKTISGSESEVQLVGLRPGEKLSEELYSKNEVITNTSHPLIKSIKSDFFYSKIPELSLRVANNEDAQHRIDSLIPK
jgi:dTDP-glucose 4,6-dehydratase